MNNFLKFKDMIEDYLKDNGVSYFSIISNLHDTSINKQVSPYRYVYESNKDLDVLDMDLIK